MLTPIYQTVRYMISTGDIQGDSKIACNHFESKFEGVIKTMSKMGISTVASYRGAQIFESIGLNQLFIDKYFTKTATRIEGIGIDTIAEARHRHSFAFAPRPDERSLPLDPGGVYQWRATGKNIYLIRPPSISYKSYEARRFRSF